MKSPVWGNVDYPISQPFGIIPDSPYLQSAYAYAADYGWPAGTHIGIDVGIPAGVDIYAAESGTVIQSGFAEYFRPSPLWILQDKDGSVLIYGHAWENYVNTGDHVEPGDKIARSGEGETQKGTWTPSPPPNGPHMHFELREALPGADQHGMSGYQAADPTQELTGSAAIPDTSSGGGLGDAVGNIINIFDPDNPFFERVVLGAAGIVIIGVAVYALIPPEAKAKIKTAGKYAALL